MTDWMITITLIKTVKNVPNENDAIEKVASLIPQKIRDQFSIGSFDAMEIIPSNLIKSENIESY